MAKVIDFPAKEPPEPKCWVCQCGCVTHFLLTDGTAQCSSCKASVPGYWKPVGDVIPPPDGTPHGEIHVIGEPVELIKERFKNSLNAPDILAAVAFHRSGRVHSVIYDRASETDEQRAWWRRRVVDFLRQLFI